MEEIKLNMENLTEEEREQLLKLVEKANRKKVWKPEDGKEVYALHGDGYITGGAFQKIFYKGYYTQGNLKQTKKECEKLAKRRKVQARLEQIAEEYNEPIDWESTGSGKYCISYCSLEKKIHVICTHLFKSNNVYFSSYEICEKAIAEIGEDDLKIYLGVEE